MINVALTDDQINELVAQPWKDAWQLVRATEEKVHETNVPQARCSPPPQEAVCKWAESDPWGDMPSTYDSACGQMWSFIDGGPAENRVRFCHGCGKPVEVVPHVDEAEP